MDDNQQTETPEDQSDAKVEGSEDYYKDVPQLTKDQISKLSNEELTNHITKLFLANLNNPANHGKTR